MTSPLAEIIKDRYVLLTRFQRKYKIHSYPSMVHTLHFRRRDKATMRALESEGIDIVAYNRLRDKYLDKKENQGVAQ